MNQPSFSSACICYHILDYVTLTNWRSWKKTITADPEPNASVPAMERRRAALLAKTKEYQAEEASLKVSSAAHIRTARIALRSHHEPGI